MTITHLTVAATGLAAATATLALWVPAAQATQGTPGCAAVAQDPSDIGALVALRKQDAARYLVAHWSELSGLR